MLIFAYLVIGVLLSLKLAQVMLRDKGGDALPTFAILCFASLMVFLWPASL